MEQAKLPEERKALGKRYRAALRRAGERGCEDLVDRSPKDRGRGDLPGYKEKIRFAALSLDGLGISRYGDCALVLRDSMISHRASVFEENSTLFARPWSYDLPPGFRAVWKDRGRVVVAKLADGIGAASSKEDFPGLLLRCGAVPEEDHFVEVHIWGPLSVYCFETVNVFGMPPWASTLLLAFESDLARADVKLRFFS